MSATNKSQVLRDKWNSKESIFWAKGRRAGLGNSHSERSWEIQKQRQRQLGRKLYGETQILDE